MTRLKPLQHLRNLDPSSPQFHEQFNSCLRGSEYRNAVLNLQGEDLSWLVECLHNVSFKIASLHSVLNTGVGSHRYFRSYKPRVPGMLARTQNDMWCQRDVTKVVYAVRPSS